MSSGALIMHIPSKGVTMRHHKLFSILLVLALGFLSTVDKVGVADEGIAVGVQVGEKAPDFSLKTLDDQTVRLGELTAKGNVVLVGHW